jgi:ATP-dependent RNA helicase DeaD
MGREGIAFTFVCKDEGDILTSIESRINSLLVRDSVDDDIPAGETTDSSPATEEASGGASEAAPAKRRLNRSRRPPSRSSRLNSR